MRSEISLQDDIIDLAEIEQQRLDLWRARPHLAIHTCDEAERWINRMGFCFIFSSEGVDLPNLRDAIAGSQGSAGYHDPASGRAWDWKDSLPVEKRVFLGKLLRKKPTFVSLELLPYFYALSENYGDAETDYLDQYEAGKMSVEAKQIYEALLRDGPQPTSTLRRAVGLNSKTGNPRFDKAIVELQSSLHIVKCGISDANRWKYCYVYDVLPRWLPEQVEAAGTIKTRDAMRKLISTYLRMVFISTQTAIVRLFGWNANLTERIITEMKQDGILVERQVRDKQGNLSPVLMLA